jgi:hypothetical protein
MKSFRKSEQYQALIDQFIGVAEAHGWAPSRLWTIKVI